MFINNIITYIKHRKVINDIIKEEDLLNNLSKLFGCKFKQDWIGRIYTVLNPIIQTDISEKIFGYDVNGTNLNEFMNKWVMDRMIAADAFIKNHGLFDILLYEIKKLDEDNNYLLLLTPIAWNDFWKSTKILIISLLVIVILIVTLLFVS